jgi:cholesterol oxidase
VVLTKNATTKTVSNHFDRRKFLGMSALAGATIAGSSIIGVTSCKKEVISPPLYGEDTEAVVIGSGFGGAVAALRLTEAGVPTILLEMGKHYEVAGGSEPFSSTLQPDGRSTWLRSHSILPFGPQLSWRDKQVGVLDRIDYENMKIYRGTCLGGGSVVYGCMLPQANDILWPQEFPDISYAEMEQKWYPKVRSVIPTRIVPDDILNSPYYQFARVALEHSDRAGMQRFYIPAGVDFNMMRDEIEGRSKKYMTNGDLLYGVNSGAKHSVDRNYIPAAIGTGKLTVQTLTKVKYIEQLPDGRYEVQVEKINLKGMVIRRQTVRARYVFVCAGTVGTSQILLRSQKEGGLQGLERIGEGVGTNGNIMAIRGNLEDNVGAQQGIVPVTGYYQPDNPHGVFLAEQAPLPIGFETKSLGILGVTVNEYRGKFVLDDSNEEQVSLSWSANGLDQGLEATRHFMDQLTDRTGGRVTRSIFPQDGYSKDFTYHPLGGVVRGQSSDGYGRLKGYNRLYAIDGSMISGSTCAANPALTIAAIAERSMDHILRNDLF